MRIPRITGGVFLVAAGAALLFGLQGVNSAPVRWGADGHVMAARAALSGLPTDMPAFFLNAGAQLEYLSPEPDRWRNGRLRAMDEAWKYDHYIDLENVPPEAMDARDRFEFLEALFEAGVENPQQTVGFLPFRILELHQRLTSGFARWRTTPDEARRAWIEARILNDAGILSHYVVDAAQPHHTTIHFNGWADGAANPRGFTTSREFHSQFESAFVRAHIVHADLAPRVEPKTRDVADVRTSVWDHVRASNATVERLYELEQLHGFEGDAPAHADTREFAIRRLLEGAEMLRALWWKAWEDSEAMAAETRDRE